MIITEIKIKDLKVRISEFEDLIFDKNILPIFTTPSILREVDAKKLNKYKIETLNPQKKLTFKIVSFNEIIEELAYKINKIAIDLEPFYYADPSDFNSLNHKIKEILSQKKLIEDKINIENAKVRIKKSTIKKKKLILYAKKFAAVNKILKKKSRYNKYKLNYNKFKVNNNIFNTAEKILIKKINLNDLNPIFKFNKLFNYRFLNLEYINLFNKNNYINKLILFSGLIPTSKGALMLLEDSGWDLDLLSNRNHISQQIKKLRPYKLRILRRLRRLRRLRLINTNLFLHRSNNVDIIIKDQENQGRNLSILNLASQINSEASDIRPKQMLMDKDNNFNSLSDMRDKHSLSSIIKSRIIEKRKIKTVNNFKLFLIKHFLYSIFIFKINERRQIIKFKKQIKKNNKILLSNRQILVSIIKLCKKIRHNNYINTIKINFNMAAQLNYYFIFKNYISSLIFGAYILSSPINTKVNYIKVNNYNSGYLVNNFNFLKSTDNKLKFIIN
jgi:hypothetical protein